MAKRTGKDLAFVLAGTAVAVMRGWTYEENDVDVDSTAAGDTYMDRDSLRGDFTVEFNSLLEIASPYVAPTTLRGTKTAFSCEIIAADANGIVSGTAKFSRLRIEAAYDGLVQISGTMVAAGTAPQFDLTPAT